MVSGEISIVVLLVERLDTDVNGLIVFVEDRTNSQSGPLSVGRASRFTYLVLV